MKQKIWHISDTHTHEQLLKIPDVDIVIHSGDFSNYYDKYKNYHESINFIHWFGKLPIKHKVLIAGNHDASAYHKDLDLMSWIKYYGIHYLEDSIIEIESLKIYGNPTTPTFGNWYFMKARHKMDEVWKNIPENIDIFIGHGPPKGILDLSYDYNGNIERCGDKALLNHLSNKKQLKLVCFGHIHNNEDIVNAGTMKLANSDIIFSNGSIVTDRKFGKITSNGNIFEL